MSKYLIIACTPCSPIDADVLLDNQPFKFGTHELVETLEQADIVRNDMAKWCNPDHVVIFDATEIKAMLAEG